ncbi:MAG: hypothetical protein JWN08_2059 [Frankiales bacterium]|nr:hypothetical protein [Frankiales bacterium]
MHPLRAVKVAQGLLLPHGGQHRARQNAWSGMSREAALGRDRREAEHALAVATAPITARSSAAR